MVVEDVALSTTRVPLPVLKSEEPFLASTVKIVLPAGVEPVVLIVRIDASDVCPEPKLSVPGENTYVAPLGNADVMLKTTPFRAPLPLFVTVTV